MGNPNPFYRFKQGWNAGFYPDNQIVSDLLNEVFSAVIPVQPSWVTPGVTTISQLRTIVNNFIQPFNAYPYYGNFSVNVDLVDAFPLYNYTISIRDNSLYAVDNTQEITITGTASNPGKVIATSTLNAFFVGSYSGSFDATLVTEEEKAIEALNVVNLNGSAVFPITYSYDSTSGVATSGLARAKNLQLFENQINRLPADTLPRLNNRTFQLPQLNGDDSYIISIIERIIKSSLDSNTYAAIFATFNSFTLPDGWTSSVNFPSYTTYERVQFNFIDSTRRKFILVGRKDSTWLWQRFVSDDFANPAFNFLTTYAETTALPYEPNQAGRWLFNSDTYDYEFVEFTSGCYESPEFYPMPAKPGDQWQFNVVDANLTGIDEVSVGLFTESGDLVQKIGTASRPTACTCSYSFTYTFTEEEFNSFRLDINEEIITPPQIYYTGFYLFLNGEVAFSTEEIVPNDFLTTPEETLAYLLNLSNSNFLVTGQINEDDSVSFNVVLLSSNECQTSVYHGSFQTGIIPGNPEYSPFDVEQFTEVKNECCYSIEQHQASVTIPSKQGCYRIGMYNSINLPCELTFTYQISAENLEAYLISVNGCFDTLDKRIFWSNGLNNYSFELTNNTYTAQDLADWANQNIPGMNAIVSLCFPPSAIQCLTYTWTFTVECGETEYIMSNGNGNGLEIVSVFWQTDDQNCVCNTSYSLYSLSNIINIDRADCFSTILEFWADSNSIAQGMEYYNDWKQRVRIGLNGGGEKPVIEESLYRQSNGVHRRPQNKQDLSLDLHTDFFDLDTQLAMTDATRHPYLIWEGKSIFVKGDIEVATTQDFTTQSSFETLSQMKFQALIQGFQPRNSSCLTC